MKILKKIKSFIDKNIVDLLTLLAMLIIAINSITLNVAFGFYVVSLELIITAYFLSKIKKE